jgi:hypothetical protein
MMVEICKLMHWDYHTYQAQPREFIEAILSSIKGKSLAQEYFENLNKEE